MNPDSTATNLPVLIAGGGIGGLSAALALALARQGVRVKVREQATELGEIGAGIQLGPNGFAAFDALDETLVGRIPKRFYDAMEWLYGWNVANCLSE